ncbi:PP0621 family protein [Achromobacter sp. Marseille-Q4962]|uniref:PP0621 family protein n=1 Tax=Achromobacter sp. Marseille-Q4962 TaxID=2942202 RepID=UPI0020747CDB|nr:PP0621 family protein [Achromobacter sp. Marseille-Q4962]
MGKLLFWILLILAALTVARIAGRMAANRQAAPRGPSARPAPGRPAAATETMVRCAHCGIHLPRSEALLQGGQTWCSAEHARLGAPRR